MLEPTRATRHIEQNRAQAAQAFARHEITKHSDGRWLLQKRYGDGKPDWTFAVEIIALAGGALYVGGDIAHVLFAYGPPDPIDRVRWMGENQDLDYYVAQKARIGMGDARVVTTDWDSRVAREELAEYLRRLVEADELPSALDQDFKTYTAEEILHEMQVDSREHFLIWAQDVFRHDEHETLTRFGTVLSPAVIYAHAALARLCVLLREEAGRAPTLPAPMPITEEERHG